MNSHVYMRSDSDGSRHAVLLGLLAAAGLFLLIPFSQMMSGSPETLLRPAPKVFVQTPPDIILIDEPILDEVVVDIEVAAFEPEVLETSLSDFGGSLTLGKGWAVLPDLKVNMSCLRRISTHLPNWIEFQIICRVNRWGIRMKCGEIR